MAEQITARIRAIVNWLIDELAVIGISIIAVPFILLDALIQSNADDED